MLRKRSILGYAMLKMQHIPFGKNLKLIGMPIIYGFRHSKIDIGSNVTINSSFLSNLLGLYQRSIIIAKEGASITIGDRVGMSGATIYAWDHISIGMGTLIGANVKIVDTDFHPIDPEARRCRTNASVEKKFIKIGENVFIGMNAIILKGTEIGNNCVVGAGAVVSGKFDDNCVIAGNPAHIIKRLGEDSYVHG